MGNFITNSDIDNLRKRLVQLVKHSNELKFLVGFFYFSGIRELYEGLKSNPDVVMRVLVGLNVDKTTYGLFEYADDDKKSDEDKTYDFFESIKNSINTDDFDTKEFYEQVSFFIKLIENGRLVIRKTFDPNHAKLYIFKLVESQIGRSELFITGSSNLTRSGLTTQNEFNVEISDYGFREADDYFEELWGNAVKITEFEDTKRKLIDTISGGTHIADVSPFEAFCLVLKTYLESFEQKDISQALIKILEENDYTTYQYQLDAVKQALAIIEKHNGVIIADVVGLGKTIIACAVAMQLKKRGIVICPPGLVGDKNKNSGWKRYTEEFKLYDWEVRSLGELESILEYVNRAGDFEVVIIDEAHRFRNQDTETYELLKNICREKKVILLTATPFNNRPDDIFALLKLFITPKKSSITFGSNVEEMFRGFRGVFDRLSFIKKNWSSDDASKRNKALLYYKAFFDEESIDLKKVAQRAHSLARQIRNVIEPITIRRNRLDLQKNPFYRDESKELSKVENPREWFFELTAKQSEFYTEIIENYFGPPDDGGRFKGAIYRPYVYETGLTGDVDELDMTKEENRLFQQQRNLFDFMRRLIVKRFESSFGAFEQTIKNFKETTERSLDFINRTGEYILDRYLIEKIYEKDIDEIEKHLVEYEEKLLDSDNQSKRHKRYRIEKFEAGTKFIKDIESDIKLFDEILSKLSKLELVKNDPKSDCLVKHVKEQLKKEPARKLVIFSEYVDTVSYLEKAMTEEFGAKMLVVAGDLPQSKINRINTNFDASSHEQEDDYNILLTSDKISEGFNLNRAGMVINYDIPWNPVRVIQRLGRINRISKKVFENLYIVNFFPTEIGAGHVKSREIATNKMFLIHNALGEDAKIFDIDEEPQPAELFRRIQQNPDDMEEESFYTKALQEFEKIKKENPSIPERIENLPLRVKTAKKHTENELLVFFKKGTIFTVGVKTDEEKLHPGQRAFEDIFEDIICGPDEKRLEWNNPVFWKAYNAAKEFRGQSHIPYPEISLEQKALNNLEYLLGCSEEKLMPFKDFLWTLRDDITSYGTLPDYTIRRITGFKPGNIREIKDLREQLGPDYLSKEKQNLTGMARELIVAIENKKI